MHYLVAAEQGSPDAQASLAWLLDQSLLGEARETTSGRGNGGDDGSSSGGSGSSEVGELKEVEGEALPSEGLGGEGSDGSGGVMFGSGSMLDVVDAVRAMGGNPEAMARAYRRMAAEQGDADAR